MQRWVWLVGAAGLVALVAGASLGWAHGSVEGAPQSLLVAGAVLLLLYALFDHEQVSRTVRTRSFAHGSASAMLVLLAATAGVAAYALARQHDHTWDLTRERAYTLSDHTVQVLRGVDEPVEVLAFFRTGSENARDFRNLVDRMREHTDRLKVRWIDPLREPRLAEEHDVTSERGTVILRTADGRTQRLEGDPSEEEFVRKLVLLLSDTEHRICWALGHGEPDPDDEFDERGMGVAVIELEELNYRVTRQVMPTTGIDPGCEALVVARPGLRWEPWELEALAAYLGAGGRVLLMIEPDGSPELAEEMERYGLRLRPDVVLDLNPENQLMGVDDPSVVVLHGRNLLSHPITANLAAAVVLPIARSVEPVADPPDGIHPAAILRTSEQAWGETGGGDPLDVPEPDPGTELVGEVPVMAVVEIDDPAALEVADPTDPELGVGIPDDWAPKPGGRLVVVGDGDFAANGYLALGNNRDLFLNTLAWLVDEEDQIGERPEAGETLEIDDLSAAFLCLISVVFVPAGVAGLAILTWLRRRRL